MFKGKPPIFAPQSRAARSMSLLVLICTINAVTSPKTFLAQTSIGDVHDAPRSTEVVKDRRSRDASTSTITSFKSRVDLVMVPVSVTDNKGRAVLGLVKENFRIYENKRLQVVDRCSNEDAPLSIGILLDTSGSMQSKLDQAREAISNFLRAANPQDELFLITFSDTPLEILDLGTSFEQISNELLYVQPTGSTALIDAVYLAITKLNKARHSRKAILIVSDGGDNHSRYAQRDVHNLAKEADVMIYGIGLYDHFFETVEERLGPVLMDNLSTLTGGKTFIIEDPRDLTDAANKIAVELRNLYMISYNPKQTPRDGKWHKIRIKLVLPKELRALQLHAREGYYATAE